MEKRHGFAFISFNGFAVYKAQRHIHYKQTHKYSVQRRHNQYHMVQWWNCNSMKYIALSWHFLSVLLSLAVTQPINKCLIENRCCKGLMCACMRVRTLVEFNEWNEQTEQIRSHSIHFYGHIIWPANNAIPMNNASFHSIVSFIFISTILPFLSLVLTQTHEGKGMKKTYIKDFFLNFKLIMNVYNTANTMYIMTISPDNSSLGLSDRTKLLFYSNNLNSFFSRYSRYIAGTWYNRFVSDSLAWNICETNPCSDQWMDLFFFKKNNNNKNITNDEQHKKRCHNK